MYDFPPSCGRTRHVALACVNNSGRKRSCMARAVRSKAQQQAATDLCARLYLYTYILRYVFFRASFCPRCLDDVCCFRVRGGGGGSAPWYTYRAVTTTQGVRESLLRTESALSAVAASFGAREDCLQRWKEKEGTAAAGSGAAAGQTGDDGPLRVSGAQSSPVQSSPVTSFAGVAVTAPAARAPTARANADEAPYSWGVPHPPLDRISKLDYSAQQEGCQCRKKGGVGKMASIR